MSGFIVHLAAPSTPSAIAGSCAARSKAPRQRCAVLVASGAPRSARHDVNSGRSHEQRSAVGQHRSSESAHVRNNGVRKENNSKRDPVALGFADDYDRDYFDDLKAEYADDPDVTIYGKDDYSLDDLDVDWLDDDIDADKLRAASKSRPVPDGFPFAPLLHTDIHSEERVRNFKKDACTYDPTTGVPWEDVPHDMHRYPECGFSDFRHDDTAYDHESIPEDLPFEPMKRRQIPEAVEMDALRFALNELEDLEDDDAPDEFFESDGNVPQPSDADFSRWAQASESRGGDSTEHESYVLPPMAPSRPPLPRPPLVNVPPQFSSLVRSQIGNWEGHVEVVELGWAANTVSVLSRVPFEVESEVNVSDEWLTWETSLFAEDDEGDSSEHCSSVDFAWKDYGEDLSPERAVFADGSYVSHNSPSAGPAIEPVSLSPSAITWLTRGSHAATELSFMTDDVPFPVRTRVILCAREESADGPSEKKRALEPLSSFTLAHLIVIRENRVESHKSVSIRGKCRLNDTLRRTLIGSWSGSGLSLQPLFPRAAALMIKSSERWLRRESIESRDVHWAESNPNEMREGGEVDEAHQGSKKTRRSKRVRAAAAHDARRLSRCSLLCTKKIGDDVEKSLAWNMGDSEVAFSPRLGKFVTDCFAIALTDTHVLSAPCRKMWPAHQNQVALTEVSGRNRRRLVACRGVDSQLVGAVLLVEEPRGES